MLVLLLTALPASAQDKKFSVKATTANPPKELNESIRKLLGNNAVQFFDPAGRLVCEVWLVKELPAQASAEQIKNGITYRELKETQVIGAVQLRPRLAGLPKAKAQQRRVHVASGLPAARR